MKIIYCGDVVGRSGREAVLNNLEKLRETYKPDVIVVNVENAAHGFGVTPGICRDFLNNGVNMLVTGNHVWQQRELIPFLNESKQIVRARRGGNRTSERQKASGGSAAGAVVYGSRRLSGTGD